MFAWLFNKLMGKPSNPVPAGLVVPPTNIPVPVAANDPTPARVELMTTRAVLRYVRNDGAVLPGSTVVTKNNAEMRVARAEQKPPYVICVYKGRRLAVRAENCGCYWTTVSEPVRQ